MARHENISGPQSRVTGSVGTGAGAQAGSDAPLRWWEHRSSSGTGERPAGDPVDVPIHVLVRDVLDFFEKCPRCGYPAQASATVRTFRGGLVRTTIHRTCGVPCGWQEHRHD